jgi:ADP-ribose pyrophosphatase YjhB (NUDIX family)
MARADFYNDPAAPKPTSIVVAASAFVLDSDHRLLMIRRTDSGLYALPGGRHELGETMTATAIRETYEETGVKIKVTGLVGIYSNPNHVIAFSDGEIRQEFSICFRAHPLGGTPRPSDESTEVEWVERDKLRELDIHPSIMLRIEHGFADRSEPYYS